MVTGVATDGGVQTGKVSFDSAVLEMTDARVTAFLKGLEAEREALLRQPTLAVLYITGYADRSLQESGRRVIDKPFTAERLVAAVEATLEEQARG